MLNPDNLAPIRPNPKEITGISNLSKSKPSSTPKSDYKKIAKSVERDKDENTEETSEVDEGKKPSVFDLASKSKVSKTKPEGDALESSEGFFSSEDVAKKSRFEIPPYAVLGDADTEIAEAELQQSIKDSLTSKELLNQNPAAGTKLTKSTFSQDALEADTSLSSRRTKSKVNVNTRLDSQENADIAYLNVNSAIAFQTEKAAEEKEAVTTSRTIKEIVDQLVEGMRIVKTQALTETIVTLKHPPLFEGVDVRLMTLNSDKRELNIAFTNLSEQAKNFIDQRLHQDSLSLALEQKGFVVHTIITTTEPGIPPGSKLEEQWVRSDRERQQGEQKRDQEEETA